MVSSVRPGARAPQAADLARDLLAVIDELAAELHPRKRRMALTLDSSLDRDVGIDSLSRVELLARLERRFNVTLPDQSAITAETSRDLLLALARARPGREDLPPESHAAPAALKRISELPEEAATLIEALEWHAVRHPDRPHITLYSESENAETISYGDLLKEAESVAAGLEEYDLHPGEPVAIMLPTSRDYFSAFFGVLLSGAVPVPLYPPHRLSKIEEHVRRQAGILSNARAPILVGAEEVGRIGTILKSLLPRLRAVRTVAELSGGGRSRPRYKLRAGDTAMLQYTSGSTGDPKGVVLSHANLLANIRAMADATGAHSADVFVSWLPLYHDMGLIGAWLGSLYIGARAVLMSPLAFLARPHRWLRTIHAERGTISAAPNFAYDLCATKIDDASLEGLDLSSWRLAFNGAEAVHADTLARFCEKFSRYGFRKEALMPVYGLAESSVGLVFPPPGRGPVVDRVRRDAFESDGRAAPSPADDPRGIAWVSCGRPLPGHEIRIVDDAGREIGDREQGRLEFRGPSATAGYYRNPEATRKLFRGAWLDSGDYGYVAEGEVYVTGRAKDLIIKGGRNLHPQELEQAVGRLAGVRKGCVAVFGSPDPRSGTERLIIVAETREENKSERESITARIQELTTDLIDVPPDDVVLVPPRRVPKTPSGKIQRFACRRLYEEGELRRSTKGVGLQIVRLAASSFRPALRRVRRCLSDQLYAGYAWLMFGLVGGILWLGVVTLPVRRWRRSMVRCSTRFLLRTIGIRITVEGLEQLPAHVPCVIAANHFSYLDSVVLGSILPPIFSYVAKRELAKNPLGRLFFNRLGVQFVERLDPEKGIEDVASVTERLSRKEPVVIFPEGTFSRAPGLLPFRMGAFLVAAKAGAPVIPVAIRGSRSILRGDDWFPRRGAVRVTIAPPVLPDGDDWRAAVRLRDETRRRILGACGEPDLERP